MLVTCMLTVIWGRSGWCAAVRRRRVVRYRAEAGGPLYLYRLLANRPESALE